jgi:hypothetical protein
VLRVSFDRRGEREQLVVVDARDSGHGGHDRLATGEGAGLVEDDDVELAGPLERQAVLDEEAVAGTQARGDGDDERDGQAQGVGTGDDEDGRRPH